MIGYCSIVVYVIFEWILKFYLLLDLQLSMDLLQNSILFVVFSTRIKRIIVTLSFDSPLLTNEYK